MEKESASLVQRLWPELRDEQVAEAEENLDQYVRLALRMYDRILKDPDAHAQLRTLIGTGGTLR